VLEVNHTHLCIVKRISSKTVYQMPKSRSMFICVARVPELWNWSATSLCCSFVHRFHWDLSKLIRFLTKGMCWNDKRHFEHPLRAPCPTKPQTFLHAGTSQLEQSKAALTMIGRFSLSFKGISSKFISRDGSCGSGMTPARIMFSCRKRSLRGRFK